MNEAEFRRYLKRRGKKPSVTDRNVNVLKDFASYLLKKREKNLDSVTTGDIDAFVMEIERKKKSARGHLYALMNYFHFLGNKDLLHHTKTLRLERTRKTRRIFPIKEFLGINQDHIKKLATIGIKNVDQMLKRGGTKKQREQLSKQLGIPEGAILELAKLSDITRLGYVKKKLSRLYYDAGLDSPAKIAAFEPNNFMNSLSNLSTNRAGVVWFRIQRTWLVTSKAQENYQELWKNDYIECARPVLL